MEGSPYEGPRREDVRSPVHPDEHVARIAAAQRGIATTAQLLAAGLGRGAIEHRVRTGRLHRRHVGVFAVGHTAPPPLAAETAALLACGPDAVLSHRSAGSLWGLTAAPADGRVDVTVPGRHVRRAGIRAHRASVVASRDVRVRDGLRVTAPARTLLDAAEDLSAGDLERAVAEAFVRRLVSRRELTALLARSPGRRGSRPLGAMLAREGGPALTRSEAERRLLALVRAGGLPAPEVNVRLCGFEVDFLWRRERLAVEVDGYAFHSTRAAFERDRRKDGVLADAGFAVRRFTWRGLVDEPERVLVALARALA